MTTEECFSQPVEQRMSMTGRMSPMDMSKIELVDLPRKQLLIAHFIANMLQYNPEFQKFGMILLQGIANWSDDVTDDVIARAVNIVQYREKAAD